MRRQFVITMTRAALVFFAAAALLSCGGGTAPAERAEGDKPAGGTATPSADKALVLFAAGDVSASTGGEARRPVAAGDSLGITQSITTGPESICELQLGDRAVIRIEEKTEVRLEELFLRRGEAKIGFSLTLGVVLCKVEKLGAGESFRVRSKTAVCGVRGTEFGVIVDEDATTILAVKTGRVSFFPAGVDPERLAKEAATGDPELGASLQEAAEDFGYVVTDDREAEMTAAAAAMAEDRVRALQADAREYAMKKATAEEKKERIKTRFKRFRDEWRKENPAPRRLAPVRRERLKPLDLLKRRRIEAIPRPRPERNPDVLPAAPSEKINGAEGRMRPSDDGALTLDQSESLIRIEVNVEPRAAAVFLNGRPAGRGRFQGLFAPGERLSFDFRLLGYDPQSLVIDVGPNAERVYRISLQRRGMRDGAGREGVTDDDHPPAETSGAENISMERRGPSRPLVARERPSVRPVIGALAVGRIGDADRIYAADDAGTVFCLDSRGRLVWKKQSEGNADPNWGPRIEGGVVIFAGERTIVRLNAADGKLIEEIPAASFPGDRYNRLFLFSPEFSVRPTATDVVEIFNRGGHDAPLRIEIGPEIALSLLADSGFMYAADTDGMVRVFDLRTGRPLPRPIRTSVRAPVARGFFPSASTLYVAGTDRLACLDTASRRLLWQKPIEGGGVEAGELCVNDAGVYVSAAGRLFAFSARGKTLFPPLSGVSSPPAAFHDSLLLGRVDGGIEIVDAHTGRMLRRFEHQYRMSARPAPMGDFIVAGTEAGEILIINPSALKNGRN